MGLYNYVTATGTILPDTATIRTDVENEFKEALGQDLDTSPSTIQGRLIDLETFARISVLQNNCRLANQINPDLAEKNFLDSVSMLSGVIRDGAESSTVTCTMSGVNGTFVPSGTLVSVEDGPEWELVTDETIPESGSVDGQFRATETGPVSAQAGTITKIVSGPLGFETVTNAAPATVGKFADNDFELRSMRRSQIATNANRTVLAIQSKILAVQNVRSLSIRENLTDITEYIDGKPLVPHSTYVVVDGGIDEEIADAYYEAKSTGSNFNGDTLVEITDEVSSQPITVKFDRPELKPKKIKITVDAQSGATPTDDIKNALLSYADTDAFAVSKDISSFDLASYVNNQIASIFIKNCEIAEEDGEFICGTLETKIFEKAVILSADDIEVIYV